MSFFFVKCICNIQDEECKIKKELFFRSFRLKNKSIIYGGKKQ